MCMGNGNIMGDISGITNCTYPHIRMVTSSTKGHRRRNVHDALADFPKGGFMQALLVSQAEGSQGAMSHLHAA